MSKRSLGGAGRSIAGAAGLLLLGLAGPGKAAELDGELLDLVEQLVAHLAERRAKLTTMTDEEQGLAYHEQFVASLRGSPPLADVLAEKIAGIPTKTPEGVRAKARALVWQHGGSDAGPLIPFGDGLFESLLADLTETPFRPRRARPGNGESMA